MDPGRRILLFGGTTEGRKMAQKLSELGYAVTVCVATQTGADYLAKIPGLRIETGRKDALEMAALMQEGYLCCIDATHPYAVEATESIRSACARTGLDRFRLLRKEVTGEELEAAVSERISPLLKKGDIRMPRIFPVADAPGACALLKSYFAKGVPGACALLKSYSVKGAPGLSGCAGQFLKKQGDVAGRKQMAGTMNVLLTTGAREASCFIPLMGDETISLFIRVLPVKKSMEQCLEAGFTQDRILSGWGPYTTEENIETLTQHRIDVLVTKDGGIEGGYPEKLAAAALCGVTVVAIQRPQESGSSEEDILRIIERKQERFD